MKHKLHGVRRDVYYWAVFWSNLKIAHARTKRYWLTFDEWFHYHSLRVNIEAMQQDVDLVLDINEAYQALVRELRKDKNTSDRIDELCKTVRIQRTQRDAVSSHRAVRLAHDRRIGAPDLYRVPLDLVRSRRGSWHGAPGD